MALALPSSVHQLKLTPRTLFFRIIGVGGGEGASPRSYFSKGIRTETGFEGWGEAIPQQQGRKRERESGWGKGLDENGGKELDNVRKKEIP